MPFASILCMVFERCVASCCDANVRGKGNTTPTNKKTDTNTKLMRRLHWRKTHAFLSLSPSNVIVYVRRCCLWLQLHRITKWAQSECESVSHPAYKGMLDTAAVRFAKEVWLRNIRGQIDCVIQSNIRSTDTTFQVIITHIHQQNMYSIAFTWFKLLLGLAALPDVVDPHQTLQIRNGQFFSKLRVLLCFLCCLIWTKERWI